MKGTFFIALNDMVTTQYGDQFWSHLLDTVQPHSEGCYSPMSDYQDRELADIMIAISEKQNVPVNDIQHEFGKHLFTHLTNIYPQLIAGNQQLFAMLLSLEDDIHNFVRTELLEPGLPEIVCQQLSQTQLAMEYRSPRRLCFLTEGLLYGAAQHFQQPISIAHTLCMHHGHDHCLLTVSTDH